MPSQLQPATDPLNLMLYLHSNAYSACLCFCVYVRACVCVFHMRACESVNNNVYQPFHGQINASLGLLPSCIVSIWLLKNPNKS